MVDIEFILRAMEWERAQGSLQAILSSYSSCDYFEELEDMVEKFIVEFGEKAGID